MMGVEDVNGKTPWIKLSLLTYELDGHVRTPGSLRELGIDRHAPDVLGGQFWHFDALSIQPDVPLIFQRPSIGDFMTPMKDLISVIDTVFDTAAITRRQVKFARHTACIVIVCENTCHELFSSPNSLTVGTEAGDGRIS